MSESAGITGTDRTDRTDGTAEAWHVELKCEEGARRTRVAALVRLPDGSEVRAHGHASRHPSDSLLPRIGEEIAAARALNEVAMQLLMKARDELDGLGEGDEGSGRSLHALR
ncbi:dsRBD fold-containing protein [Streptomyces sp. NPDC056486]|uniref:dsRBD fold-containing protein n=1 Tax=Streptomyces sp. NPDC056486 TaxID=3345835 RepID=UPI0036C45B2E